MRSLCLLFTALTACTEPAQLEDAQQVRVEEDGASLTIAQRFDDEGSLLETVVTYERGADSRVLRVEGALLTEDGATDAGASVRTRLSGLDPRLIARLVLAEPRFDIAVLAADALLSLDSEGGAHAVRVFAHERGTSAELPLCAHLSACEDVPAAPTT
jgi:hypothetical protein